MISWIFGQLARWSPVEDMPGSVVAAPAVGKSAPSEQTHMNGHCNVPGAEGVDAKTASLSTSTREPAAGCEAKPAGENGKKDTPIGDAMNDGHSHANCHRRPTLLYAEQNLVPSRAKGNQGHGYSHVSGRHSLHRR